MISVVAWLGALAFVALPVSIQGAQPKPDFSGGWVFVPDPATPAATVRETGQRGITIRTPQYGSFGPSFTATQNAETLTLDVPGQRGRSGYSVVYRLDGTSSRNKEGPFWTSTTATWDGAQLVLVTKIDDPNAEPSRPLKRVLRLDSRDVLLVETSHDEETTRSSYARSK